MPPPLIFDPESLVIIGLVGGSIAIATYVLYRWAGEQGKVLAEREFLLPPFPGPPLVKFDEEGRPFLA